MDRQITERLPDHLMACADAWVSRNDASLARLGRLAANDSSFFNRVGKAQGPTTATLEKFADYFGNPENWPEGDVPLDVMGFVHRVKGRPVSVAASIIDSAQFDTGAAE